MGYMLPLKFINVQQTMAICATRILTIMQAKFYQAKKLLQEEKRAGTLVNAAGRKPVLQIVMMDNGTVIASSFSMKRLLDNIAKANQKVMSDVRTRGNAIKLYAADVDLFGTEQISMFDEEGNINEAIANALQDDENEESDDGEEIYADDGEEEEEEVTKE